MCELTCKIGGVKYLYKFYWVIILW